MMAKWKKKTGAIVWLRRLVQAGFLLFFFYLFLQTAYHPIDRVGGRVTFFFEIDPLVMIATWIAAYTIPTVLLLSLITLAVTIFCGRWFCGWVCPFGVIHNLFTSISGGRIKEKIDRSRFTSWQRTKYYVLIFFLVGTLIGANIVGWLDPFSFFYRSMATAIYPAINWGTQQAFLWIYHKDPSVGPLKATAVTEPVYEFLRTYFFATEQPFYYGGMLIGFLFIGIVGLNFFRTRFWCRYICPLGALLGVAGKNPVLRLTKDNELCNDCRLCLVDCQGGAEPQSHDQWKPSECFYCWNCESTCPSKAITFSWGVPEEKEKS